MIFSIKKYHIITLIGALFLFIFLFAKKNTAIYVGDYSGNTRYTIDIKIRIDDKEILNDSLMHSFPYRANFVINERLRYGLHKISVCSDRINVNQEKRIFLLPNQFIYIEFFPADTLTFRPYDIPDSVIMNSISLVDSIIEQYKVPSRSYNSIIQDTLDIPYTEKSSFDIRTIFSLVHPDLQLECR